MSVQSHLTSVASALVLSPGEESSIGTSIATLDERLRAFFGSQVPERFQFGSSKRGTILPRRADQDSDVDYLVRFNNDGNYKPETLLARLRRFAEAKYSRSEVKQSHPTMVLSLNHIHFELVPAVRWWNSATGGLLIPSPAAAFSSWMPTDPKAADAAITNHNVRTNFLTKPLVRLLKFWNTRTQTKPFESFEIEQFVTNQYFFGCQNLRDYFFAAVRQLPSGWGKARDKQDRIAYLKSVVAQAKNYEISGLAAQAEREIKKVIPAFP